MRISREHLLSESAATGFPPEVLEKVFHLLTLAGGFNAHPFLKGKLALKGGAALNLFVSDLPRLSVDIDLNYIGARGRDAMLAERPKVEEAVAAVCRREGFEVRRVPDEHAGGKWRLRYDSALGTGGNLEVDLNFMLRVPLWPAAAQDSRRIGSHQTSGILVADIHELAAGKLSALLSRHAARDLFDACSLFRHEGLDRERLRLAFVVYGGMSRTDWRTVSPDDLGVDAEDTSRSLLPLLRGDAAPAARTAAELAYRLVDECREGLRAILPFADTEREFLDKLLDRGEIEPSLLTDDEGLAERIRRQPGLEWKAINVRQHKGL